MNDEYIKSFRKSPDSRLIERIHARLEKRERRQRIKRYSFLSVLALTFVFGLLMTFSSTVRAEVLQALEEIAGLRFEVTNNYPGGSDESVTIVPSEYLSLEDAQSRFPSPVRLPSYLPPGYEQPAQVQFSDFGEISLLTIRWERQGQRAGDIVLEIRHCSSGVENCGQIVGEGAVEEIMLNEKPAVLVRGGWNYDTKQYELYLDSRLAIVTLMWKYDHQTVYMLFTDEQTVSVEELIKVAESIP